ncbi:MAG: hypothetical protein V4649_01895 [Bacteroidota bacterium]
MKYYTFSALVFNDGQIRDAYNLLHKSEEQATLVDFRNKVEMYHAGLPDTYTAIIIPMWEEISEDQYAYLDNEWGKINEKKWQKVQDEKVVS